MAVVEVAVVKHLFRFPVKSMSGEELVSASVYWYGIDGDRRWAFVKSGSTSSFPWLTGRDVPAMIRHVPTFVDPADPLNSPIEVQTPDGGRLALSSPELRADLETRYGAPVHLMHLGRGAGHPGSEPRWAS